MAKITGIQVKEVIDSYTINQSILETAKATGISTVKVRKILITEGLWQSNTSIKIGELLSQGMTTEEIADRLYMSVKNVQAFHFEYRLLYSGLSTYFHYQAADTFRGKSRCIWNWIFLL